MSEEQNKKMDRILGTTRDEKKKELMDSFLDSLKQIETISKVSFKNANYENEELFKVHRSFAIAKHTINAYTSMSERVMICDDIFELMAIQALMTARLNTLK